MKIRVLLAVKIDEIENQPQPATPNDMPFHVAMIWDSPRIRWEIWVIFAEDVCWIATGCVFDM